ncbi:hypothetical protein SVAN01_04748 [Stagonosporopsis vannaccii]|nr:hypothetical protein SVAN01_04748 [Stagonosporopsis vannaccii]
MRTLTASTTATPANAVVLAEASQMLTISRFHYLLQHSKALVQAHGPYKTHKNTTVLTRAMTPRTKPYGPSSKCMATSLAAAQDCIGSAQVPGPAKEDLHVFKHLWDTTVELLEGVLATGDLDHESFGWGIWGLCAGYLYPPSEASYEVFEEHKHRLHEALLALPTVDSPMRKREGLVVSGENRVEVLANANRQVHICASLVLQRFRQEGWHRIRWWHGIKIAERWMTKLGLEDATRLDDGELENERSALATDRENADGDQRCSP